MEVERSSQPDFCPYSTLNDTLELILVDENYDPQKEFNGWAEDGKICSHVTASLSLNISCLSGSIKLVLLDIVDSKSDTDLNALVFRQLSKRPQRDLKSSKFHLAKSSPPLNLDSG